MLKRKKIFIATVVLVLMLAMAATAYATTYTCSLLASNTGSVKTAALTTRYVHRAGYNQSYSTNYLILRLQRKNNAGEWAKILSDYQLRPGQEYHEPQMDLLQTAQFRTKIYSKNNTGGAEGVGSINN